MNPTFPTWSNLCSINSLDIVQFFTSPTSQAFGTALEKGTCGSRLWMREAKAPTATSSLMRWKHEFCICVLILSVWSWWSWFKIHEPAVGSRDTLAWRVWKIRIWNWKGTNSGRNSFVMTSSWWRIRFSTTFFSRIHGAFGASLL